MNISGIRRLFVCITVIFLSYAAITCLVYVPLAAAQHNQPSEGQVRPKGWTAPFTSADIGSPALAGSTKIIHGEIEASAAGKDVWGVSDQFRFVYQQLIGDFDIAVRVSSLTAPHLYSRAGLMARESTSPDSRHLFFLVFADNQPRHNNTSAYEFQYREETHGTSKAIYPAADAGAPLFPVAFPNAWLRMRREGSRFTAFASNNGKQWKEYGSQSIDMPLTLYVGLAVTSHKADATATATFRDLRRIKSRGR